MSKFPETGILIAGAGASGLFCAWLLSGMGLKPLLVEAGAQCGRKLAISGGGRANFSNLNMDRGHYLCEPDAGFCSPALKSFPPGAILKDLRLLNLPFEKRDGGRLFLKAPARKFASALEEACIRQGCIIMRERKIHAIHQSGGLFRVECQQCAFKARKVALATGSPAFPQCGANASGYKLASMLGHTVNPPKPALVPLVHADNAFQEFRALAGISASVVMTLMDKNGDILGTFPQNDLLFTHDGLSGPAILQASLYWHTDAELGIDFLAGKNFERILDENPRSTPRSCLRSLLAPRLADALLAPGLARRRNAELGRKERKALAQAINFFRISGMRPSGLEKAEICRGGVAVNEICPETMESRITPGLHIMGELLDVAGQLGGYNLHWAFASAACAARAIAGLWHQ